MICSNCKTRWAYFPEDDFTIDDTGIHAKNAGAGNRRKVKYESNKVAYCGCIERDAYEAQEALLDKIATLPLITEIKL